MRRCRSAGASPGPLRWWLEAGDRPRGPRARATRRRSRAGPAPRAAAVARAVGGPRPRGPPRHEREERRRRERRQPRERRRGAGRDEALRLPAVGRVHKTRATAAVRARRRRGVVFVVGAAVARQRVQAVARPDVARRDDRDDTLAAVPAASSAGRASRSCGARASTPRRRRAGASRNNPGPTTRPRARPSACRAWAAPPSSSAVAGSRLHRRGKRRPCRAPARLPTRGTDARVEVKLGRGRSPRYFPGARPAPRRRQAAPPAPPAAPADAARRPGRAARPRPGAPASGSAPRRGRAAPPPRRKDHGAPAPRRRGDLLPEAARGTRHPDALP